MYSISAWLSLRAGGWGFNPLAIMNVTPAYFCRKIEEKQNQSKSTAVKSLPTCIIYPAT